MKSIDNKRHFKVDFLGCKIGGRLADPLWADASQEKNHTTIYKHSYVEPDSQYYLPDSESYKYDENSDDDDNQTNDLIDAQTPILASQVEADNNQYSYIIPLKEDEPARILLGDDEMFGDEVDSNNNYYQNDMIELQTNLHEDYENSNSNYLNLIGSQDSDTADLEDFVIFESDEGNDNFDEAELYKLATMPSVTVKSNEKKMNNNNVNVLDHVSINDVLSKRSGILVYFTHLVAVCVGMVLMVICNLVKDFIGFEVF